MKPLALLLPALVGLASLPASEVPTGAPQKVPLTRYSPLWNKSPFTTPPVPIAVESGPGPFDELALRGVAQLTPGHYLLTLANKKNPEDTQVIDTERNPEYQVLKVERDPDKPLGTVVTLKKGSITGTVSYDEKISSAPKTQKPAAKPGQHPGQPPQAAPGQPQIPNLTQPNLPPGVRPPRQRVVPTPGAGGTPGVVPGTIPSGVPGAAPGAIPGVQPPGFNRGSSGGRPDFRGNRSESRAPRR